MLQRSMIATPPRSFAMNDVSPLPAAEGFLPYALETLSDGRQVLIRPMNPGDADAERTFIAALSPRARRYRFQEQFTVPDEALVNRLVDVDHVNDLGWTALLEAVILGDGGPRHTRVVRILLRAGADPTIADGDGVTPRRHAELRGFTSMAEILARAGG